MKMYILIKEAAPIGLGINAAAHAALAGYLQFKDTPEVIEWLQGPFRKVTCKVTEQEFETAKQFPDHRVLTESAWENKEIAIVFKPRAEWPKAFQFFRLYKEAKPQPHLVYTSKVPEVSDMPKGKREAYYWVRGGNFNRPQVVYVSAGVRSEIVDPISQHREFYPDTNFTFHGPFHPNIWRPNLKDWAGLQNLEWAGPIVEP